MSDPRSRFEDLVRSQRTMILTRWIAAPWAVLQVVTDRTVPYPPGARGTGVALAVFLAVANLVLWHAYRRTETRNQARALAIAGLAVDTVVISGFVWLYAFEPNSALWAALFILPLEGAISFQLRGALGAWGTTAGIYVAREIWGSARYDYPLEPNSITFRMGIGFIIALVAGMMARDLVRQGALANQALAEVRRVEKLRSDLVSTLAHDVRTPLTVIRGVTRLLLAKGDEITRPKTKELLESADRQGGRLERLATDLLEIAKLEEGELELDLREIELDIAVRSAIHYVEGLGDVEIDIPRLLRVRADPRRVEQIVVNLMANAQRYGKPPYEIRASAANGIVTLEFVDHGPGLPEANKTQPFQPFTKTAGGASGFGLAIVKALAEAHGGRVSYHDVDPHGARFSVALPTRANARTAGRL